MDHGDCRQRGIEAPYGTRLWPSVGTPCQLHTRVGAVQEGADGVLNQANALGVAVEWRVVGLVVWQQRAGSGAPLRGGRPLESG